MILRLMSLGIPVAGFFAASVLAGQAETTKSLGETPRGEAKAPQDEVKHKIVKLRVITGSENSGKSVVSDGDGIEGDVDDIVSEALAEAMEALDDAQADIRVELDGKKLKALSDEHRKAIEKARARLKSADARIAERMARVEVRVERAAKRAEAAAEKAGKALKERKVVILRDSDDEIPEVEVETNGDGRTVIVIKGENVKVITREKHPKKDDPEGAGK